MLVFDSLCLSLAALYGIVGTISFVQLMILFSREGSSARKRYLQC